MTPIHPGTILFEEFLRPLKITTTKLARNIQEPKWYIDLLINGKAAITNNVAVKLSSQFDNSVQFWLNLQECYNQKMNVYKNDEGLTYLEWICASGGEVHTATHEHFSAWKNNEDPTEWKYCQQANGSSGQSNQQ